MNKVFDEQNLSWIDELAEKDYVIVDNFLNQHDLKEIKDYLEELYHEGAFKKASIGTDKAIDKSIRGDFIFWLDKNQVDGKVKAYLDGMDRLIALLNRYCFLSISSKEFHFAVYPKGTFYKRHLDQFKERDNRLISVVFYLNDNWTEGDGGELKIYRESGDFNVNPIANRLVLFKSDVVEHEVLLSNTQRKSITGWLLYQPNGLGYLT